MSRKRSAKEGKFPLGEPKRLTDTEAYLLAELLSARVQLGSALAALRFYAKRGNWDELGCFIVKPKGALMLPQKIAVSRSVALDALNQISKLKIKRRSNK